MSALRLTIRGERFRCDCDNTTFHRANGNYVCDACGTSWADPRREVVVDVPVKIR